MASASPLPKPDRLTSLDVFRGATIAAMILVNNPGDESRTFGPLLHADWSGWTFTDTIFPSFLWMVGLALTLSFARRLERGDDRRKLFLHVVKRALILYLLGLFLNLAPEFHFATARLVGVLPRIAICYLAASAIFLTTKLRGQIIWCASLLAVYSILLLFVPVPGAGAGSFAKTGNMERYMDGLFLTGHIWSHTKYWDPEGIVSTLPSICTTLFGVFAGHLLRAAKSPAEKAAWLFTGGLAGLALGAYLDNWFMPINKNLWTVSFAVFMAGVSASGFALCYWLIDACGFKNWSRPFSVFGMNAIACYVLADFVSEPLEMITIGRQVDGKPLTAHAAIFRAYESILPGPQWASLAFALTIVAAVYVIAWVLYRRKVFIRI
ncbi:MAG: heparan-alpha-glucosaminide N-acetyltransferase domain-containing protein [Acidobacteria bacterium]|nr:heparan-alpha-glucosaminide N-acetyltransferase domain-containing protein [Acidobacteriota bacterium]